MFHSNLPKLPEASIIRVSRLETLPSGKRLHSCRKSQFLIGKPSINGPLSIAMLVYQRVMPETAGSYGICHMLMTRGIHNDKLGIQFEIMGVSYGI